MTAISTYIPPLGKGLRWVRVDTLHTCDIRPCQSLARFDASLPGLRTWGYICPDHARSMRIRLGLGAGQLLLLPDEEVPAWVA